MNDYKVGDRIVYLHEQGCNSVMVEQTMTIHDIQAKSLFSKDGANTFVEFVIRKL